MSIREALEVQLRTAMRARDKAVVAAVRSALSALANAQAVPAVELSAEGSTHFARAVDPGAAETPRLILSEAEQRSIVATEIAELVTHAEHLAQRGRTADAEDARRAAAVLTAACASPESAD